MFYLTYLKAELIRRIGKTLIIAAGLAIASAIIITIISTSQGLSNSQKTVLNPLENVGTDILVSRSVDNQNMSSLDEATRTELASQNQVTTDLSKLGKPGDSFSLDTFMPGTMLTFASSETKKLTSDLAKEYSAGLILNVTHQEGKIPTITAEFQTGGERVQIPGVAPMTDAERAAVDAARQKAIADGADPTTDAGRQAIRAAEQAATPDRFKGGSSSFTAPTRTYRQTLSTPQTDIKTSNYTIAGVDTSKTDIGLILPSQITEGTYFKAAGQAVINLSYAQKNGLKVGNSLTINGKKLPIVGIVDPKLYTNTADIYVPLADLQTMSGKADRINIILIKATDAKAVDATSKKIAGLFAGANVTNSKDTASKVTGSLMDAASLMSKFIGLVSIIIILAAFIIVSLITVFSVNKRTGEIGTLKAIGWKNSIIVRQIFLENLVIGIFGAVFGVALGIGAIMLLNHFNITFSANVAGSNIAQGFPGFMRGFGRASSAASSASTGTTANLKLNVALNYLILLLGAAVAIVGSVVAGLIASFRASKMKPQEALRQL
jgi:ABC-type antimicrobial peptide transport system permease subunit